MKTTADIDRFLATIERFPDDNKPTYTGYQDAMKMAYQWVKTGVMDQSKFIYMMSKLFQ